MREKRKPCMGEMQGSEIRESVSMGEIDSLNIRTLQETPNLLIQKLIASR